MTANRTITELYQALRPLLLRDVAIAASGSRASSGGMETHALNSNWHTGQLAETQAPWAATKNEWATALATHAALPDVHHAAVTAGALVEVVGQQVGVAPGTAYQFIGTGSDTVPEWRNVSELAGNGLTAANGVLAVGVANTGAVGLSVEADAVRLTSSSNPGASASILATNVAGLLTLVQLTLSERLRASLIDTALGDLALSPASGITTLSSLHASTRVRTPLLDTAAGNMTVSPAADLTLSPGSNLVRLAAGRVLQSDNYASQTTGMRISYAGEGDFRYLFTDELHAKSFIADLEQALAGGQIISKSVAVLASAFTAPAAGGTATLVVRDLPSAPDMACFVSGDIVRLRQFSRAAGSLTIADCWGVVTGYVDNADGTQSWTFTRSAAPNAGAMTAGTVIAADAIVLDYGTTGNGFYEVNAIDGAYGLNSPYAQIVSWSTHPATGATVRSRLGNLRGVFGVANEYGLYAGSGTATSDAYLRISNTEVGLYNLPLRMYTGGTERVHIAAHNDVWIGPSSADKRLSWDGSTLTVRGAINVTGGNAATFDNITGAQNLVRNSSFELDSNSDGLADSFSIYNNDGDSVPTTASRVAGEKSTWAQRISWTGTNASTKGIYFNSVTAKRANVDYVLTFWARTNTAVNLGFSENAPAATQTALIWPQANSTWQFFALRLRWSSTPAAGFFISLAWGSAIANGWIEFDNIQVIEGSEIVPYAPALSDLIAYGGAVQMPAAPSAAGLYATSSHLGYYNGSAWRSYIDSGGNFYFAGSTGARLEYNASAAKLRGVDSSAVEQWYASASDGSIYFAAGKGKISATGLKMVGTAYSGILPPPPTPPADRSIEWTDSAYGFRVASITSHYSTSKGTYQGSGDLRLAIYDYSDIGGEELLSQLTYNTNGLKIDGAAVLTTANRPSTASGNRWGVWPEVNSGGVMEIGKYIDFHETDADTSDYSARITSTGGTLYTSGAMDVNGAVSATGSNAVLRTYIRDDTSKYFAWYATAGAMRAIHNVNGDLLRITDAGRLMVGNTADLYSAKIQTNGNVHAQGSVTSESYLQVQATTAPAAAAGWARIALRSSDNALVAIMPSGAVRVLATN